MGSTAQADTVMQFLKSILRDASGSAAVEFAIIAPVLAAALVGMLDLGQFFYERADINSALRMAAQTAMSDPGTKKVTDVLNTFKSRKQFSGILNFEYNAVRFCACPDMSEAGKMVKTSCELSCPTSVSPSVFYRISGGTKLNGILISEYKISNAIEIQIE